MFFLGFFYVQLVASLFFLFLFSDEVASQQFYSFGLPSVCLIRPNFLKEALQTCFKILCLALNVWSDLVYLFFDQVVPDGNQNVRPGF